MFLRQSASIGTTSLSATKNLLPLIGSVLELLLSVSCESKSRGSKWKAALVPEHALQTRINLRPLKGPQEALSLISTTLKYQRGPVIPGLFSYRECFLNITDSYYLKLFFNRRLLPLLTSPPSVQTYSSARKECSWTSFVLQEFILSFIQAVNQTFRLSPKWKRNKMFLSV